jgi:hypothetical protein
VQIGAGNGFAALAAVAFAGCFNPSGGADGEATQATTGGPPAATTSSTGEPGSSSGPEPSETGPAPSTSASGEPTTGEVCTSACVTTTGPGDTGTDTGSSTATDDTTGGPPVVGEPVMFSTTSKTFGGAFAVAAVNFDGDAWPDVFVTSSIDSSIGVAHDGQIGSLGPVPGPVSLAIVAIDLAAHPAVEVAIASGGLMGQISTYHMDMGVPTLGAVVVLPDGCKYPITMAAGLITADDEPDLVVGCDDFGARVLMVEGVADGSFAMPLEIIVAAKPTTVALADIVGAPLLDLVVAGNGGATVYEGVDPGMFKAQAAESFPLSTPQGLGVGDINDDDLLDVVVGQPGQCTVLLGDPTGLELGKIDICGPIAHDVALADLNQDGYADLISAHDDGLHIGFNGDDRLDIVMTSEETVSLYLQLP